jgi:hypothetical protein
MCISESLVRVECTSRLNDCVVCKKEYIVFSTVTYSDILFASVAPLQSSPAPSSWVDSILPTYDEQLALPHIHLFTKFRSTAV